MSKRLLFVLLTAALAAATVVGLTVPANAELRTVTVQLADGSTTTVTVDVPPGTPLDQVQIPTTPVPTVPLPAPLPNPTAPSSPAPTPNPTGGGSGGDSGSGSGDQTDQAPNASDKGGAQKTTGTKDKAKPNALDSAPNAEPQREVKNKLDKINEKL